MMKPQLILSLILFLHFAYNNKHYLQLRIFSISINGERAYSLFVTNFGHADNSSTFVPCVKSMAAGFDRKFHNFPTGDCPLNSSDESLLLRKSFMKNTE